MSTVGSILSRKREAQGLSVEQIATRLCITSSYLRAIEADDVESLPGAFFYKSFALQYAAILEIEPESLRAEIDAVCKPKDQGPVPEVTAPHIELTMQHASRTSFSKGRMGAGAGAVILLFLAAGFSVWRAQTVTAVPVRSAQHDTVAVEPTAVETSEPVTAASENQAAVLNLEAREVTWLSITSEGKEIFEGILWPRQSKTLTGLDMALLKVGNAGGLDISWNGKPIGPIGETGEVRVVVFSADDFRVLPPGRTL